MHRTLPTAFAEAEDDRFTAGEVQYFGFFLDAQSQRKLAKAAPPAYKGKSGNHVTVLFSPSEEKVEELRKLVGKRKVVQATHVIDTGEYQAVRIHGIGTDRGIPHVTISWAEGSSPSEGNRALRRGHGEPIQPWLKLNGVFDFYPRTLEEEAPMHRTTPAMFYEDAALARLSDEELTSLLAMSDEELEAEGMDRAALEAEEAARADGDDQGAPPAPTDAPPEGAQAPAPAAPDEDPVANEPVDDPAPEKDDPVVLQVQVIERDGNADGGSTVKTFEFSGPTKDAALGELKVAARRNKLIRSAMNEVPYKGRNFYLKQNFLDQDPDQPEGEPAEESYLNRVADPGNAWQALAIREAQDPKWKELEDKWRAEQQEEKKKPPAPGAVMGAYEDAEFEVRGKRTGRLIAKAVAASRHDWMLKHYTAAQFAKAWDQASGIPNAESRWAQAASILTGAKQLSAREKKGRRALMKVAKDEVKRRLGGGRG